MKEFVTFGYSYKELSDVAKEKVKEWYLNDPMRIDLFYECIKNDLTENFYNSHLDIEFSLNNCQGDGLNIYGDINLLDFLNKWDETTENKNEMKIILNHSQFVPWYTFKKNNRYGYSCKFIDKKYIEDYVEEMDVVPEHVEKRKLIKQFYLDMIDYFEDLDKQFEKSGYKYLYECDEEEVQDFCESNDYYFTEEGEFIG